METNTPDEVTAEPTGCISCNHPIIVEGHPISLCSDCRTKFINFPIPKWVILFGTGIILVMLISLYWLPGNLSAAISLSRAEMAEQRGDYITAQRELEKAKQIAPKSMDILGHLMIASFYNSDFNTMSSSMDGIANRHIEDTAFYHKLNAVVEESKLYSPSDTFNTAFKQYINKPIPEDAYKTFLAGNPGDVYAAISLASLYSDKNLWPATDSLLSKILTVNPHYIPALNLKTVVKREMNQLDSSIYYCDRLLALNHQSLYGLSSKARTLLKNGQNTDGLSLAQRCAALDQSEPYNRATLALAYHLNKDYKHRDELVKLAQKDSVSAYYFSFVNDFITNKANYQTLSTR